MDYSRAKEADDCVHVVGTLLPLSGFAFCSSSLKGRGQKASHHIRFWETGETVSWQPPRGNEEATLTAAPLEASHLVFQGDRKVFQQDSDELWFKAARVLFSYPYKVPHDTWLPLTS